MRYCVYLYSPTKFPYNPPVQCLCLTVIKQYESKFEVQPLSLYATGIEISGSQILNI